MSVDNAGAAELAQLKEQVKKMSSTIKQLETSNDHATESAARLYHESVKRGAAVDGLINEVEKVENIVAGLKVHGSQPTNSSAPKLPSIPSRDDILAYLKSKGWSPHKPMFEKWPAFAYTTECPLGQTSSRCSLTNQQLNLSSLPDSLLFASCMLCQT